MPKKIKIDTTNYTARAMRVYVLFVVICVLVLLTVPANIATRHNYNLTAEAYHVLGLILSLPALILWSTNFFAYGKLYEYAASIKGSEEYVDYSRLALGVKWLAWSFPIPTAIALIIDPIAYSHPHTLSTVIIISNYARLFLPLVAFSIIGTASHGLVTRAEVRYGAKNRKLIILAFVAIGVLYCLATFKQLGHLKIGSMNNLYHLPIWLAIITVVIPFLYTVIIGLIAALEIDTYGNQVRGLLYRHPFRLMVGGLITVIASSIVIEYIYLLYPLVGHVVLSYRLFVVLFLRLINTAGFILIIHGVLRLKKIEEV